MRRLLPLSTLALAALLGCGDGVPSEPQDFQVEGRVALAALTALGALVASRATGRSSAIVAVPVRDASGAIVGALGSSVYLDSLSLLIKRELDLQPDQIFFSIDPTPIGALQDDPAQIFLDPYALDEPELERAIREMLTREDGVVNYSFRGKRRTVLYRKSPVSGWWYAFGHVWN